MHPIWFVSTALGWQFLRFTTGGFRPTSYPWPYLPLAWMAAGTYKAATNRSLDAGRLPWHGKPFEREEFRDSLLPIVWNKCNAQRSTYGIFDLIWLVIVDWVGIDMDRNSLKVPDVTTILAHRSHNLGHVSWEPSHHMTFNSSVFSSISKSSFIRSLFPRQAGTAVSQLVIFHCRIKHLNEQFLDNATKKVLKQTGEFCYQNNITSGHQVIDVIGRWISHRQLIMNFLFLETYF